MTQQITLVKDRILPDNYFTLCNTTHDLVCKGGEVTRHKREAHDRGNDATILPYNTKEKTVVLIRQFHVTTWVSGNENGQLIEARAGLLDNDGSEACIRKEVIEKAGYEMGEVRKSFKPYTSSSGVTELIHFSIAEYSDDQRASVGGGVEGKDIEVLELPPSQMLEMTKTGEIRDGRTVLLFDYLQTSHLMDWRTTIIPRYLLLTRSDRSD